MKEALSVLEKVANGFFYGFGFWLASYAVKWIL